MDSNVRLVTAMSITCRTRRGPRPMKWAGVCPVIKNEAHRAIAGHATNDLAVEGKRRRTHIHDDKHQRGLNADSLSQSDNDGHQTPHIHTSTGSGDRWLRAARMRAGGQPARPLRLTGR